MPTDLITLCFRWLGGSSAADFSSRPLERLNMRFVRFLEALEKAFSTVSLYRTEGGGSAQSINTNQLVAACLSKNSPVSDGRPGILTAGDPGDVSRQLGRLYPENIG